MKLDFWSKRMGAVSLAAAMLFTGNAWAGRDAGAQEPETLTTVATVPTTRLETEPKPTESPVALTCAQIAENADGRHILVCDGDAGELIYCNTDLQDKFYPASITKLYAALVGLMYLKAEDVVTAGAELRLMPGDSSRAYLSRGCQITVEMLVEAMLIPSGSDASYVFAAAAGRAIAGDAELDAEAAVEAFLTEMNRQAEVLGLQNSHFTNPDGYHDEAHYMCPADVAAVAVLALNEPVIAKYMGLQQDSVVFASGEHITWYNNNLLIDPTSPCYSADAVGMKTGYTGEAGNCLLAAFRQGDRTVVVGIFGSAEKYPRYQTAVELYEACLEEE